MLQTDPISMESLQAAKTAYAAGNREPWDKFLISLFPATEKFAYKLCQNNEDAEDAAQKAISFMARRYEPQKFTHPKSVIVYARFIVRNKVVDRIRQENIRPQRASPGEYHWDKLIDPKALPEDEVMLKELEDNMHKCLTEKELPFFEALKNGETQREYAKRTGFCTKTVMRHVAEIRKKIKKGRPGSG